MIRVSKADLEQLRFKLDQMQTSAFFMETYVVGLEEKIRQLKKWLSDLETVGTRPVEVFTSPGPETLPEE
jgi:hypothetical protein